MAHSSFGSQLQSPKSFELSLRQMVDQKFERPVDGASPIARLIQGKLPIEECRNLYVSLWPSLMVFNRVLLARLIERAPSVEFRVGLMEVVAPEFGRRVCDAHPVFFRTFLEAIGVKEELRWDFDLETGPCQDEVRMLRKASFSELLARLLVGESVGPKVFESVAAALHKHYGIAHKNLTYFSVHAKHDKRDTEILFDLLGRAATTLEDQKAAVDLMNHSYEWGRYKLYACNLPGKANYQYSELYKAA